MPGDSAGADPSDVVIAASNNAGKARDDLHDRCVTLAAAATTYGIQASATFMAPPWGNALETAKKAACMNTTRLVQARWCCEAVIASHRLHREA